MQRLVGFALQLLTERQIFAVFHSAQAKFHSAQAKFHSARAKFTTVTKYQRLPSGSQSVPLYFQEKIYTNIFNQITSSSERCSKEYIFDSERKT
jgi:hypothetical protein